MISISTPRSRRGIPQRSVTPPAPLPQPPRTLLSADDALRLGIVDIVASDETESCVQQLADDLLRTTPIAQSILKQALAQHSPGAVTGLIDSLAGAYLAESKETIPTTTFRRSQQ